MSALNDAFQAIRRIALMDANIERLETNVSELADSVDGLADGIGSLRDRVSRLEGFIEGAATVSARRPELPLE